MKALEIKFQGGDSPLGPPLDPPLFMANKKSPYLNYNLNYNLSSPTLFLANKKVHISKFSRQIFTNLPRMCEKQFYVNKMKLKWQNCFKQKIYRSEKKFISREEAYINKLYINYTFSLRAAFMQCISFIQGTSFKMRFTFSGKHLPSSSIHFFLLTTIQRAISFNKVNHPILWKASTSKENILYKLFLLLILAIFLSFTRNVSSKG